MDYNFTEIEKKWQQYWRDNDTYRVTEDESKPKYYVLDMFPYPSGSGLHVGHPLGYIASDILSRYMRHKGYNVLHPMGFDAFGLPAEQYAIQTGQHPEITTQINTAKYREQLDNIGFSYDWSRKINTSDPEYYKWTQWTFIRMFESYFDTEANKALPIAQLVEHFEKNGSEGIHAKGTDELRFTAEEWRSMSEVEQQEVLMNYRIAYLGETVVNWCADLGTVLANDEVSEGLSVRGGFPVVQKVMTQWCLRTTAYADRLLEGLKKLDWNNALKETQRNWIGRSSGTEVTFDIKDADEKITVFTTRADTLFGVTFMVLAPESDIVDIVTSDEQRADVEYYIEKSKLLSERERMINRKVTGVFTGGYAVHPVTGAPIPIWVSDYVVAGYGTGAVMAVPAHDTRDFAFAKHFELPIVQVVQPKGDSTLTDPTTWDDAMDSHEGTMVNSDFLNGLDVDDAIYKMAAYLTERGVGSRKVNYKLRDAIYSRQRYWGEPFPIYYKEGMPYPLKDEELPLTLPEVDKYLPTEAGDPPLGRARNWKTEEGYPLELNTMPGFAGSSAYFLRYMDPHNDQALVDPEKNKYWRSVDLYVGGTEHATGHLIYSRFWNMFLYDLGLIYEEEPYKRLVNQGMIQGRSNFIYRIKGTNTYVTYSKKDEYDVQPMHVDIHIVHNDKLDLEAFKKSQPDRVDAEFILEEDGTYLCGWTIEKMGKTYLNVVNPDDIIEEYGADTLRVYEMFLGPLEQAKPWDTNGIDGVFRFLRRVHGLYFDDSGKVALSEEKATPEELKILHTAIKKVSWGIENISFNTCVSAFMVCLNDLQAIKCNKRAILEDFIVLLSPFAPHLAEEIWHQLGHDSTVTFAPYPELNEAYLKESIINYPISVNGKVRLQKQLPADLTKEQIEEQVMASPDVQELITGKEIKKVIVVPGRIVNLVTGK
ncbi:MAG: leucine--tRNA ligase [Porphyromonas sp.]|nr:leucine--tRNA ligase [Porphyromonas sp.]